MSLFRPTRRIDSARSGQALIEMSLIVLMLLIMVLGLVDYSRLFLVRLTMSSLSREGANLGARGTDLPDAADAVVASAATLNINSNGFIILSLISRDASGTPTIIQQETRGGRRFNSLVGTLGATGSAVHLPSAVHFPSSDLPPVNQTMTVAEVFYVVEPITPVGNLLRRSVTKQMYEAAYY